MRLRVPALFLVIVLSSCTFQVDIIETPTAVEPMQIGIPTSYTSTPFIPTALPVTSEPSNTLSPAELAALPTLVLSTATAVPTPQSQSEIRFPPNGTWQAVSGTLAMGTTRMYVLSASKGQIMSVSLARTEQGTPFEMELKGSDGTLLCPTTNHGCQFWRGPLPASQQYFILVVPQETGSYSLRVAINPLGTQTQYFEYIDPHGWFILSYSDEFAPVYFSYAPAKIAPQLDLQFIDSQQYRGTNLSEAYFWIGASDDPQQVSTCTQPFYPGLETNMGEVTINGVTYTVTSSSSAGAGNFYEQIFHRAAHNNICYEIVYLIHSTNIGNYAPGTVTEFNRGALLQKFDEILSTLAFR